MCELMSICSNMEINPEFSFKELKIRGGEKKGHKDGWGIGFYKNNKAEIIKDSSPAYNNPKAKEIEEGKIKLNSKIFISHIRYSTSGNPSYENTHPFTRKLFDKEWIFAHNGTLGNFGMKNGIFNEKLVNFKPEGQTDSEYAFCFLLDRIKEKCNENSTLEGLIKIIEDTANYIKSYGRFNFLLSDSVYLYCFGYDSLYFVKRKSGNFPVTLKDSDYSVNVSDMKKDGEKAIIVATKPLTKEENWKKINGLIVFKDGEEVKTG